VKYVVTGAAGFIGSHLTEALLAAGQEAIALDAFTPYYARSRKRANASGFRLRRLDLVASPLEELFDGVHGVFHLAAQPGARSYGPAFPDYVRNNIVASDRVFAAAADAGARVVFASSSSVYGESRTYPTPERAATRPSSPYGVTKLACEHLARAYRRDFGRDVVVLRYFTVYGPRQRPDMAFARLIDALLQGTAFVVYGDGNQTRSFTFVADAVEATLLAMTRGRPGGTYNVGGGEEATIRAVAKLLEAISGREVQLELSPPVPGDVARTCANIGRITARLGWVPRTPPQVGLEAQWQFALATDRAA
jgi:nucleoside-diphosphate-sugar epimerase